MNYNVYVHRRAISDTMDLYSYVIEGLGTHIQKVEKRRQYDNARLGYLRAYLWATQELRLLIKDGVLEDTSINYITSNSHFSGWVTYLLTSGMTGCKPPVSEEYKEALASICASMQKGTQEYRLILDHCNKAKLICDLDHLTAVRDKGESALSFMQEIEDTRDDNLIEEERS